MVSAIRHRVQVVFVYFRNAAGHGAVAKIPAQRETVEAETLIGYLVKIAAEVFDTDYTVPSSTLWHGSQVPQQPISSSAPNFLSYASLPWTWM